MHFHRREAWWFNGLAKEKCKETFSACIFHRKAGHNSHPSAMGLFCLNALHDTDHFKGGWKALLVKFLVTHHGSSFFFLLFFWTSVTNTNWNLTMLLRPNFMRTTKLLKKKKNDSFPTQCTVSYWYSPRLMPEVANGINTWKKSSTCFRLPLESFIKIVLTLFFSVCRAGMPVATRPVLWPKEW